jgi:pimeloyl-ACP methyl ester carboxylesterase
MTNRRQWLQSSSLLAAGTALGISDAANAKAQTSSKPIVVMVHGAFHWGGCFGKVANLLAQHGYPVAMPDNRSHGYDPTPYSAVKDMADYCAQAEHIVATAKSPVVLLGHSLGGVTLSYLGEKYPHKIRRLIYLSAIMCPNGESVFSYMAAHKDPGTGLPPIFDDKGPSDGVALKINETELVRTVFYNDCSDHDVKVAMANLNPINPIAPFQRKTEITPGRFGSVPRAYIECSEDNAVTPALQRKLQADVPGAVRVSMTSSHSPFLSQPEALAKHIVELA